MVYERIAVAGFSMIHFGDHHIRGRGFMLLIYILGVYLQAFVIVMAVKLVLFVLKVLMYLIVMPFAIIRYLFNLARGKYD